MRQTCHAYNWVTNLLEILRNNSKNVKRIQVIVFRMEIDTKSFTAKLLDEKCKKAVKTTNKVLGKQ